MAQQESSSPGGPQRFDKGLNEDVNDFHLPDNQWTHARNAINNSRTGDLGKLGNEPANSFCIKVEDVNTGLPLDIIGAVHFTADRWVIFSTNDVTSEIGVFVESGCKYTPIVNANCLAFNKKFLIKGVARSVSNCNYRVYWDDGNNTSRFLEFNGDDPELNAFTYANSPIPWIKDCGYGPGVPAPANVQCPDCINTPDLNCDLIRLSPFIKAPCITVNQGVGAGTLLNGSYFVAIAYAIDGEKVSDYYISNVQALFSHQDGSYSLDIEFSELDTTFLEMQVVIVSVVSQQSLARLAGIYSTRQKTITIDLIDLKWPIVPIENLPIMNPVAYRTDAMYTVNDYLLRSGVISKQDFNYQPLANQIVTKWQSIEYPLNYYRAGGHNTNYMRDEVYTFFIQWIYDTGDKSSAYHIPGRSFFYNSAQTPTTGQSEKALTTTDAFSQEITDGFNYKWYVDNTAYQTQAFPPGTNILDDGGEVIAEGYMGYWESTELYPDNKPQVWNAATNPLGPGFNATINPYQSITPPGIQNAITNITELDLCGKPIRHHKFPDLTTSQETRYTNAGTPAAPNYPTRIRLMGIKFENIKAPLLNDGVTPVPGIVGYEILRGTRNGHKSILAKGLINNMREYALPDGTSQGGSTAHYPNYPYNDLNPERFLTDQQIEGSSCSISGGLSTLALNIQPLTGYSRNFFTFHSPETNFTSPYLSAKELKIHGEFNGDVEGKFELSEEHPKSKIITNFAFFISAIAGIGLAAISTNGRRKVKYIQPKNPGYSGIFGGPAGIGTWPNPVDLATMLALQGATAGAQTTQATAQGIGSILLGSIAGINYDDAFVGEYSLLQGAYELAEQIANTTGLPSLGFSKEDEIEDSDTKGIPPLLRIFNNIPLFLSYFTQGANEMLDFIKVIVPYRDYALRYHSHCFYSRYINSTGFGSRRHSISDAQYIGPQITNFTNQVRVNNLYRAKTVAVLLSSTVNDPALNDVTRVRASDVPTLYEREFFNQSSSIGIHVLKKPNRQSFGAYTNYQFSWGFFNQLIQSGNAPTVLANNGYTAPGHSGIQVASSHYASLKQRIRNQYGQLNGITIVPASYCTYAAPALGQTTASDTVFGGDTYVTRYTEKNTFFYFYDWLYGQPDGAQFDYKKHIMIPYPRFWANLEEFEVGDFVQSLGNLFDPTQWTNPSGLFSSFVTPTDYYNLDGAANCSGNPFGSAIGSIAQAFRLSVKYSWFYLFSSGVKDFLCESDYNLDLRDWGDDITQDHYDPYRGTDTKALFDTRIIKTGNFYKYDQSLSISRLFINYSSWAKIQQRSYDPLVAETCYTENPTQIIYSNVANYESLYDGWRTFLANNYYDFPSVVTGVKSVNKSGAIFFMEDASPIMFQGLDQLQTTSGTALTIGDGQLFSQPSQSIVNTETSFEYASCQDPLSIINTPAGLFWISENQGKIFNYSSGLAEVSMQDMKWWLINYLPYKLTQDFPDFELKKNTVIGIGCQSIYDNQNGLLYFSKRDFQLRRDLPEGLTVTYISADDFEVYNPDTGRFRIKLGNPDFFQDASWTISYDPKTKNWVSYHDWHPNLELPGKNTFLTVKGNSIWLHNYRTDSYCNYYGVDYPWEVEYLVDTGAQVNTLRSIEYQLECYKYAENKYDRFHVLDFNFDEAIVYNTEQTSGMLNLFLTPKNEPLKIIQYPKISAGAIDILYSKEENRYRFNQFWDVTADRGEYNLNAERVILNTEANGYVRNLNLNNLDYNKAPFQRKKFRHYLNYVFLRKRICGNKKMLVIIANNKNLYSPR